jgi:hypothetical protein
VSEQHRRRIDIVQDPAFLAGIGSLSASHLREKRMMCDDLDVELSYYRRMLHGRMDLLAFEMRRRAGEETQSLIEALPRILSEGAYTSAPGLPTRAVPIEVPHIDRQGRRIVDKALDADFLVRLPSITDDELGEIQRFLQDVEAQVSLQRASVYRALDALQEELTHRYTDGTANPDDALPSE